MLPGDPGYDENTPHGLIVSLTEFNNIEWGCVGSLIGGTSTELFTGANNTNLIINNCEEYPIAAKLCDEYTSLGFNDWYLGSRAEIYQLALRKTSINATLDSDDNYDNLTSAGYWTSSENSISWVSVYNFYSQPNLAEVVKYATLRVRPIRSF